MGDSVKYIFGLLFLVLIVLLETSVLPFFPILGTQPSILLTTLLTFQFLGLERESYYGAFFGGFLFDLFAGGFLGFSSLILLLLSGAVGLARRSAEGPVWFLLWLTLIVSFIFRAIQAFPVFAPALFLKGGLLDAALLLLFYPGCAYFLKSVLGKKELTVGV